jgi:hypothetical protein
MKEALPIQIVVGRSQIVNRAMVPAHNHARKQHSSIPTLQYSNFLGMPVFHTAVTSHFFVSSDG